MDPSTDSNPNTATSTHESSFLTLSKIKEGAEQNIWNISESMINEMYVRTYYTVIQTETVMLIL